MEEKIISTKKNGMAVLLLTILLYLAAIGLLVFGAMNDSETWGIVCIVCGIAYILVGWIFWLGLKVLKPQEALVLTLFGKYVGTLKGDGFYYVNPFCTAVNPAATTKLRQSGDVGGDTNPTAIAIKTGAEALTAATGMADKRISLKIMTLNNNKQKINDCLGNPIEIGIAVMWRVVDTAKAVFNVDNYKEYLSLQCDTALRNIVRIYPYDVAQGVDTTGEAHPMRAA